MRKIFATLILIIFSLAVLGCSQKNAKFQQEEKESEYQKVRLIITTSGAEKGINTLVAKKIALEVAEASDGNVTIEVYPNDTLSGGNPLKGISMVADGSIDMAVYTSGTLSAIDPRISVATIPWMFDNYASARKIIDGSGEKFYEKILSSKGLVYLGFIHNGMRQIFNNQNPVRKPGDLAGLKIRTLNN